MARVALKTVRVTGMPLDTQKDDFFGFATRLSRNTTRVSSTTAYCQFQPKITFATQDENKIGTITFLSERAKKEALKFRSGAWHVDDNFQGITILSSPGEPDLDLCALHGLNGNAIQSWTSREEEEVMWLRDLLPTAFDKARIMTFGYSSQIRDRANGSGMSEWVHYFLESVSSVRRSTEEMGRPIVFICHSMGGIVARQAMVRLSQYNDLPEYQGIRLGCCGLLFLSTPHSGSTEADWIDYVSSAASLWGVRSEVISNLKSFHPRLAEGQEDFANLKIKPPFHAFYETHRTKVGMFHRQIVTRQSASLNGVVAKPLRGTDHNTICKYTNKYDVFATVVETLKELKRRIGNPKDDSMSPSDKVYTAPANAFNIRNPQDKKFFLGLGLNKRNNLKGRELQLNLLNRVIDPRRDADSNSIIISGIGGMGKTATLLEFAHQQKNKTDIFFVHAKNGDCISLHNAYYHIARLLGPDYLLQNYVGRDIQGLWSNESPEDKVERLKTWLSEDENDHTLLLVDDIDGLQSSDLTEAALPSEAKNILVTTRNSLFRGVDIRSFHPIRMAAMSTTEIMEIMRTVRDVESPYYSKDADLHDDNTLYLIALAVHGHPLAAIMAIKHIICIDSMDDESSAGRNFVEMLGSPDFEARKHFLDFKPEKDNTPSLLTTFLVSKNRLSDPDGPAWTLMEFLSTLETGDPELDYREFFFSNSLDLDLKEFPNHELLEKSKYELSSLFNEIQSVSLGERVETSKPFQFHPIWLECTRHIMGAQGRERVISQVLKRCCAILTEAAAGEETAAQNAFLKFLPHLRHCLRICKSFKVRLSDLNLSPQIVAFILSGDRKLASVHSSIRAFKTLKK